MLWWVSRSGRCLSSNFGFLAKWIQSERGFFSAGGQCVGLPLLPSQWSEALPIVESASGMERGGHPFRGLLHEQG